MSRLCDEMKSILLPAIHSADHLLHLATEPRKPGRAAIRAVAVWAIAINDKERVGLETREVSFVNPPMRQADRVSQMAGRVGVRTPYVENRELHLPRFDRGMNVPAIGLEGEQALEMGERNLRLCGGYRGNG